MSEVMNCGDEFTVDDAAKVTMQFWHEWADNFEIRLFQMVDRTEHTEICASDEMFLIHKFLKYPGRPTVQPETSQQKPGIPSDRAWQTWAAEVEELFVALKGCLLRGKALPKGDQPFFYTIDGQVSTSPIPSLYESLNDNFSPTHLSTLLRISLWMSGVKFTVSSCTSTDLTDRMKRLCIKSGAYSCSDRLSEEMAMKMEKLIL